MLPSSARERWPFCVLRDSCHAALPDQPGWPSIGSGRWTGGSRHRPRLIRLATDGHFMDDTGAWPGCVGTCLSNRKSAPQTALSNACLKIEPSRGVDVLAVAVLTPGIRPYARCHKRDRSRGANYQCSDNGLEHLAPEPGPNMGLLKAAFVDQDRTTLTPIVTATTPEA